MRRLAAPLIGLALLAAGCTSTTTTATTVTVTSLPGETTLAGSTPTTGASGGDTTTTTLGATTAIEWSRLDDSEAFDGGFMNGVAVGGPGLIAVGTQHAAEDAGVWVSSDAESWEKITSEAFGGVPDGNGVDGAQAMEAVTSMPGLVVAVGTDELQETKDVDAAVWLSTDGREWEKIEDDDLGGDGFQGLYTVTSWQGAFYAGGEYQIGATGVFRPGLWRSMDGRDWERLDHPLFLSFGGTVTALASRGTMLIAAGFDDLHENRPVIWITSDGESWDAVRSGEVGDAVVGEVEEPQWDGPFSLFLWDVTAGPDGFVAIGTIGDPSEGVVWTSEDGFYWEVAAVLPDYDRPRADVLLNAIVPTASGMVVVGASPLDTSGFPPLAFANAWISPDAGASWAQIARNGPSMALEGPTAEWHMGTMRDITTWDGRLIGVGYVPVVEVTEPGDFYDQAVWVGDWSG